MEQEITVGPGVDSRAWLRSVSAICVGVSLAVLLCVIVYKIRLVFVPFAAGFVVAYILDPLLDKLEARGWSRRRAVWTVMGLLLAVMVLVLVLLVPRVVSQVGDAWQHREAYGARAQSFYSAGRASAERWLSRYLPQSRAAELIDQQLANAEQWAEGHKGQVLAWVGARLGQAGGMVVLVLLGTLIAFHFMLIIDPLRQTTQRLFLSARESEEMDETVVRVNRMLGAYVRGMAVVSATVGVMTALVLWGLSLYFGTRYALLIGLLAGVTYAVPWLGQATSAGTAFFFGLVTADHHALVAAIVCGLVVIAINQISDNVLMPRIVGAQVGLHPLLVLFAILAGLQLFGLVGMVIAVPLAASLRIAVRRWIPLLPDDEGQAGGLPRLDAGRAIDALHHALRRFLAPAAHAAPKEPPEPPPEERPSQSD